MSNDLVVGPIMALFLAACGWLCVFKTGMLVKWGRDNYEKSKFVRAYPFSSIVSKEWYPIYLRCAGVFMWLFDLAFLWILLLAHRGRH